MEFWLQLLGLSGYVNLDELPNVSESSYSSL